MISTSEMIKRCVEKFGDTYNYSHIKEGTRKQDKVNLHCPTHGLITVSLEQHLNSKSGCVKCGKASVSARNSKSHSYYEEKLKQLDIGNLVILPGQKYSSRSRLKYFCPIHGNHSTPLTGFIYANTRCPSCSREKVSIKQRKSRKDRIEAARMKHGDRYDYSLWPDKIKNNKIKVDIICPEHGVFSQRLNDHLLGKGCLKCSIVNCDKSYVHMIKDGEIIVGLKYGISKDVELRMKELQRASRLTLINMKQWVFDDPSAAFKAEQLIKTKTQSVVGRRSLPEGFTENCSFEYFDFICRTFSKYGGIEV